MTRIFADACYWIALLNPNDQLNRAATAAKNRIGSAELITTDEVLTEVLNFYAGYGQHLREAAATTVQGLRAAPEVEVEPQSRESFDCALALYENRGDKKYSLVDCRSFVLMRQRSISEALTDDHHFEQEGFSRLL